MSAILFELSTFHPSYSRLFSIPHVPYFSQNYSGLIGASLPPSDLVVLMCVRLDTEAKGSLQSFSSGDLRCSNLKVHMFPIECSDVSNLNLQMFQFEFPNIQV